MAVKYTWDCKTVDAYKEHSDAQTPTNKKSDVIHTVHWKLMGKETKDGVEYVSDCNGITLIDTDDLSDFKDFSALTNTDIKGWITESLGNTKVEAYKATIKSNIKDKQNPTTISKLIES